MMRNSFIFYSSFYEAINEIPEKEQGPLYKAIVDYAFAGIFPNNLTGVSKGFFALIKPNIDASNARHDANIENGKKGGRPSKEKTETISQTIPNQNPKETQHITQPKPKRNPNQNPKHNPTQNLDIERDIELELCNMFVKTNAYARVSERSEEERAPFIKKYHEFFDVGTIRITPAGYEIIDTMICGIEQARSVKGLTYRHKTYHESELLKVYENIYINDFEKIACQICNNNSIFNRPAYILGCIFNIGDKSKDGGEFDDI